MDADAAAGTVIFDGIVAEIVEHLVQEPAYAEDDAALAVGRDGDRGLVCRRAKILGDLARKRQQLHIFLRHLHALV